MSRKGKAGSISKGKRRASTVGFEKGKGDDHQAAKKSLGMMTEERDAALIKLEDKDPEEELEKKIRQL